LKERPSLTIDWPAEEVVRGCVSDVESERSIQLLEFDKVGCSKWTSFRRRLLRERRRRDGKGRGQNDR
jgi:hypothetical protein